jgi:hypothetical protein
MKRGDPIYRLVLREEVRLGQLAYATKGGKARPIPPVLTRAVLAVLLSEASKAGVCWPSLTTIAEAAELSRQSVVRALGALDAAGIIQRERRAFSAADGKKGRSTVYRLQWQTLERLAGIGSNGGASGRESASNGGARGAPLATLTTLVEPSARARDAVRNRKDAGDGPDEEAPRVSFAEALRTMAQAGNAYALERMRQAGGKVDCHA